MRQQQLLSITLAATLLLLLSSSPSSHAFVTPTRPSFFTVFKTTTSPSSSTTRTRRGQHIASSTSDWNEFKVEPGNLVDTSRMVVVGSDYSEEYEANTVMACEKPGMEFDGTLIERAEVVVSMGPEPYVPGSDGGGGSISSSSGGKKENEFVLSENEYIVNRGTKIDKTRMYVVRFEQSPTRKGGTVLRTLTPGKVDEYGSTIQLAEVIASSGPDGTWTEEKSAGGQIAFPTFDAGGGMSGYTYGPTNPTPDQQTADRDQARPEDSYYQRPQEERGGREVVLTDFAPQTQYDRPPPQQQPPSMQQYQQRDMQPAMQQQQQQQQQQQSQAFDAANRASLDPTMTNRDDSVRQEEQASPQVPATSTPTSTTSDWNEFMVELGSSVDPRRMKVVGSEFSFICPVDTVAACPTPGMEFDGTLVERAEVIVSLGPDPSVIAEANERQQQEREEKEQRQQERLSQVEELVQQHRRQHQQQKQQEENEQNEEEEEITLGTFSETLSDTVATDADDDDGSEVDVAQQEEEEVAQQVEDDATSTSGWKEFTVKPGSSVNTRRMTVVGSDYSSSCEAGTVMACPTPGMEFDGTLVERAEIIISVGPDPNAPVVHEEGGEAAEVKAKTVNKVPLKKEEKEEGEEDFALAMNEFIVKRGTKIDLSRMYVIGFERSATSEAGTVLRTLLPGQVDDYGNTVFLAGVIASSGQDDDNWT